MDQAPDLIGPVVAYRAWRIHDSFNGARLRSMGLMLSLTGPPWAPGRDLRARCFWGDRGEHRVPVASCLCGFYVMHTFDDLLNEPTQVASLRRERHPPPAVAGEVEVWGRSERYERGRRVEWCRVRALYRTPLAGTVDVDALAETYGVPVLDDPDGKIGAWREREPERSGWFTVGGVTNYRPRATGHLFGRASYHATHAPPGRAVDVTVRFQAAMQDYADADATQLPTVVMRGMSDALGQDPVDPDKPIPGPRKDHLQIAAKHRTRGARDV